MAIKTVNFLSPKWKSHLQVKLTLQETMAQRCILIQPIIQHMLNLILTAMFILVTTLVTKEEQWSCLESQLFMLTIIVTFTF